MGPTCSRGGPGRRASVFSQLTGETFRAVSTGVEREGTLGDECAPIDRVAALEGERRMGEEGDAVSLSCESIAFFRIKSLLVCTGARVWYKSRQLEKTICSPSEGWWYAGLDGARRMGEDLIWLSRFFSCHKTFLVQILHHNVLWQLENRLSQIREEGVASSLSCDAIRV